jgi:hypothetical protein
MRRKFLEIPDRVSLAIANIPVDIHNEGHSQVDKYRRPERNKGYIYKEHAYAAGSYAHSFSE